jgi:shikimate dehydrogenase
MKKYLVIGNPITHSLSPLIHNYWMKKYKLTDSIYEKKKVKKEELKNIVNQVRNDQIKGVNVTVPFKKEIIPLLDGLDDIAKKTQSVNTLNKINNEVWGYNTDVSGFNDSLILDKNINFRNKNVLILGAGGVTTSIICSFINNANKIYITNRTKEKAEQLKKHYPKEQIEIIDWKKKHKICDLVINTTSVGLIKGDKLDINFHNYNNITNALFYDVIYNPKETKFLKEASLRNNKIMNGKMMFLHQAKHAFNIWTKIMPDINDEVIRLLD